MHALRTRSLPVLWLTSKEHSATYLSARMKIHDVVEVVQITTVSLSADLTSTIGGVAAGATNVSAVLTRATATGAHERRGVAAGAVAMEAFTALLDGVEHAL